MMASPSPELELAMQRKLSYTGLRDFQPDHRLFLYLPLALAQRERVLPVVLVGDTLKVASARPDPDLSLVRRRFPHLALEVVIAPSAELEMILAGLEVAPS